MWVKGQKSWNKWIKMTEEQKLRQNIEWLKKWAWWNRWLKMNKPAWNKWKKTGKPSWNRWISLTEEHKKKLSVSKKWQISRCKGKKLSEEHRKNLSISHLWNPWFWTGKKRDKTTIDKLSWDNHWNWKWDISKNNRRARTIAANKYRRKECLSRDEFTCQRCNINWWKLEVHHINNFSEFIELRYDIDNWVTLCRNCHIKFHQVYWRQDNTKEQLLNFYNIII